MTEYGEQKISPHEVMFSLDIGTRNVVGIVGKQEEDQFIIIDVEVIEHPSRSMYDGQIHDIDKVAAVAQRVKNNLENRLGFSLQQVAIAAAGRALKTYQVHVSREMDITKTIDKRVIDSLEIEGIQKAQQALEHESADKDTKYYCVGYTVINYYLNEGNMTTLKGHRGDKIGADILATFLPHVVVDSLYGVMERIGLDVINLTLEPIAAIHVAIPEKLRLLNLVLIDIGAGTSDIAITQDGTVVAYAMASVAGDEITEAIAKTFLLDFDMAEKLKIALNKKEQHCFSDIVGIPYEMTTNEIIERISGVIEDLAVEIAEKIVNYNGKAPSAVFCIGGGSQIPTFTSHLANKLGIQKERVVVRGTEIIENTIFRCEKLEGPEYITPIGIGLIALKDREQDFIHIHVNETAIKLLNTKQMYVSDALIRIGYSARKLIGRTGKGLNYYLNGVQKSIGGESGESARIFINGIPGSLDTKIKNRDNIVVESAFNGKDVRLSLNDLFMEAKTVQFNGLDFKLMGEPLVNGKSAALNYTIQEGDRITYQEIQRIDELLYRFQKRMDSCRVFVNGIEVQQDYLLKDKDQIRIEEIEIQQEKDTALFTSEAAVNIENTLDRIENAQEYGMQIYVNNEPIVLGNDKKTPYIFVDVFNYINFERTKVQGTLILKLNGHRANYTDPIQGGDRVEIYWE